MLSITLCSSKIQYLTKRFVFLSLCFIGINSISANDPVINAITTIRQSSVENLCKIDYLEALLLHLGVSDRMAGSWHSTIFQGYVGGLQALQYPNQFAKYLLFLQKFNISSYLEIGCRWGGSFIPANEYLKMFHKINKSVCLDWEWFESISRYCDMNTECELLIMNSQSKEFKNYLKDKQFDLIFIDADHSYEGVKCDFQTCKNKGEIFVFHDIVDADCGGVVKFWNELKVIEKSNFDFYEFIDQYEDVLRRTRSTHLGIGVAVKKQSKYPKN